MDGERIDRSISAAPQSGRSSSSGDDSLLLTNSRIIRISGTGGGTEVVMASVDDVDSVEFIMINEGYGAFIWAGLSVILGIALFSILEKPDSSCNRATNGAWHGVIPHSQSPV